MEGSKISLETLNKIKDIVQRVMGTDEVHGYPHVERVLKYCKIISEHYENVDTDILTIAALLHDIGRHSALRKHHVEESISISRIILEQLNVDKKTIEKVLDCIMAHSFTYNVKPRLLEAKILSDADKLDALGAIGIARAFMESGRRGRSIKDTIKHFHEKLLKLCNVMYTDIGRKIAAEKTLLMKSFLEHLEEELET